MIAVALAIVLYIGYKLSPFTAPYANKVVISFLIGAICSALSGYTGMYVSIRANIRTAAAARTSMGRALQMALRGGAVTGLVVVGLSLLGVGLLFLVFGGLTNPQQFLISLLASASGPRWSRCSRSLAAAFTRRPPTWARTWWVRSRQGFPKTIRAIRL